MTTMHLDLEWDSDKAAANIRKHAVDFDEAATVFLDVLSLTIPDPHHSSPGDERFVTIGRSHRDRILIVVHVDRQDAIRIISARVATGRERQQYADET